MAIDSAAKRRSVAGVSVGWGVTPDATAGQEWRQQVAWSYSGISAGEPPEVTPSVTSGGIFGGKLVMAGTWLIRASV